MIYPRKFHFDNFNDLYIIPPIKYISGEGVATSESGLKGRYDEHVRFQSSFSPESVIARNSIPVLQLGGESEGIKPRAGCRDNDPLNSRGAFIREDFPHEITKRLDDVLATGPVGACHTVDSIVVLPEKEFIVTSPARDSNTAGTNMYQSTYNLPVNFRNRFSLISQARYELSPLC